MSGPPDDLVFFTDRDLGKRFPETLATAGLKVVKHAELFPPDCPDEIWLAKVGAEMPPNTRQVLDALFTHPIVDARAMQRHAGLGFVGAQAALQRLESAGWVREITGKKRNRTYRFEPYLSILESGMPTQ